MCLISKEYQQKVKEQLDKAEQNGNHYDVVINKIVMPKTKKEKIWFFFVALTAGICEEIVYRSFIIFLLQNIFLSFHFLTAGILSCVLFSIMHSYQGISGVIKTGLFGVLVLLLYYATRTLISGIILHFLMDFSSIFLLPTEKSQEDK